MGKQVSLETELVREGRTTVATAELNEAVTGKVRPRLSEAAYLEKLVRLGKNSAGDEVPDPTVLEPPIGWQAAPTMMEIMRQMIQTHELEKGMDGEFESFEDADDFDVGDENAEELRSGWENDFEPEEVSKIKAHVEARMAARKQELAALTDTPNSKGLGDDGGSSGSSKKKSGDKPVRSKKSVDDDGE